LLHYFILSVIEKVHIYVQLRQNGLRIIIIIEVKRCRCWTNSFNSMLQSFIFNDADKNAIAKVMSNDIRHH